MRIIWPESITRDRFTATREEMDEAWNQWYHAASPRTLLSLAKILFKVCETQPATGYAVASAMLQYAQKTGAVYFDDMHWVFV